MRYIRKFNLLFFFKLFGVDYFKVRYGFDIIKTYNVKYTQSQTPLLNKEKLKRSLFQYFSQYEVTMVLNVF